MNKTNAPKSVLVILVNWNGCSDTLDCLASLEKLDYPNFRIVVVDNASEDNSAEVIPTSYPDIQWIQNNENLGYVGGNNLGLDLACQEKYDYALLLNNDTTVAPDFLSKLVEFANSHSKVGVVGPSIYYFDHPDILWSGGGKIDWKQGKSHMIAIGEQQGYSTSFEPYGVDFVTGCALLIKVPIIEEIGKLDARFFAYYEETEWCVRISRAGFKINLIPEAKVWHKISIEAREESSSVVYYMTRNRLLFLKITQANWQAWVYTGLELIRTIISWTMRPKWRHKNVQRKAMLQGIMDFYQHKFGKGIFA